MWAQPDVFGLFSNNVGSWANGMKLASERLLDQLPAQCLSGFHHEREALGSPLFDPRLCPMRADRVDHQGPSRYPRARRAEPPQRIHKADALHADVLKCR